MTYLFTELDRALKKSRSAERACLRRAHDKRVHAAMIAVPDYGSVMKNTQGIMVKDRFLRQIMQSEMSAEIAYYLAQRVDLIVELNELSECDLAYEIGRIAGLLSRPKVRVKMGRLAA